MTPKDKANELVDKMYNVDFHDDAREIAMRYPHAIKCALIAVEEILNIKGNLNFDYVWYAQRQTDINNWLDTEGFEPIRIHALEYWQQVKNEIEKL
jgi:hypothetical protein